MVNLFSGIAIWSLSLAAYAVSLDVSLDRYQSALGEPLTLGMRAREINLDVLDITSLNTDFEVAARSVTRNGNEEILSLTLYPKRVGHLRIPSLRVDGLTTRALNVNVTDSSAQTPQVFTRIFIEPAMPFINEAARLAIEICDDGSLGWQRPMLTTQIGVYVRTLGEAHSNTVRGGVRCSAHRYFWAAQATQAGELRLRIPPLTATKLGNPLRYPASTLNYSAKALPAWLPATVPPGKPDIHVTPLPSRWPLSRPLSWRFVVTGNYSADNLRSLLEAQTRGQPELRAYPLLIEPSTLASTTSPLSQFAVTLFILPQATGDFHLPTLRLPWFNPQNNQLESLVLQSASVQIFDPLWRPLSLGLAGFAALTGGLCVLLITYRALHWRWLRHTRLNAIQKAQNAGQLVDAIRNFSLRLNDPPAMTLNSWLRRLNASTRGVNLENEIQRVQKLRYGLQFGEVAISKAEMLNKLRRAKPG